jgi:TM2 domain-containing membrane protein YozV
MMLRHQCKDEEPNTLLAYVILIFGGWLGIHLFYLAYKSRGKFRMTFSVAGVIYLFTLGLGFTMWFLDLFLLPLYTNLIKKENGDVILNEYLVANGLKEPDVVTKKESGNSMDKYNVWRKKG